MNRTLSFALFLSCAVPASSAYAQSAAPSAAEIIRAVSDHPAPTTPSPGHALMQARVESLQSERAHGFVLLAWGTGSMVAGGVLALSGVDGERGLATGVNTLVWGAVNTALAVPFLLAIPAEHAAAVRDETLSGAALAARREAAVTRARTQATVFAFNAWLDVAYVVAGTFVCVLGANNIGPRPWMEGIGVSAISQGAFLLGFDIAGWVLAGQRAGHIARVPFE
jgi:hypothetical protein